MSTRKYPATGEIVVAPEIDWLTIPDDQWDWFAFLDWACQKEFAHQPVDEEVRQRASSKAGEWVTCACGQLCERLPRFGIPSPYEGAPVDKQLFDMGMQFYNFIAGTQWSNAAELLSRIEERTQELLTSSPQPSSPP